MELTAAIQVVTQDVHASYPHLSRPLAIQHALDTVSPPALNHDDPTAPAYLRVHQASVAELTLAIAKMDGHTLDHGDVHESPMEGATIDGMNPFEWLDAVYYDG